ncbi:MAG: hypothetical protein V3V56_06215, partial [bacterium]
MPRTHQWILYSALTAGILSGCAAGSGSPSFSGFIETTQKAVVSAYETTKKTVVSTYNRITGTPADKPKEKAPPAEKSTGGAAAEGFPARSAPNYEEDIRSGRLRAITEPQVRGEGARRIRIIPRDALGPGELAGRIAEIDRELKWERDPRRKSALARRRRELAEAREKNLNEERI